MRTSDDLFGCGVGVVGRWGCRVMDGLDLCRELGQRRGKGEGDGEDVFVFRGGVEGDGGVLRELVDEDGCFERLDDFGGVELPPPKYSFNLAEALLPISCLFLFLVCSCTEPRVDVLHFDLSTLSSRGRPLVCSQTDGEEGEGGKENGDIMGV